MNPSLPKDVALEQELSDTKRTLEIARETITALASDLEKAKSLLAGRVAFYDTVAGLMDSLGEQDFG